MKKTLLLLLLLLLISATVFSQSTLTGVVHYESNYSQQNIDHYFSKSRKALKNKKRKLFFDKMYLQAKKVTSTLRFTLKEGLFELDKKISTKDRIDIAEKISSIAAGGIHKYYQNTITKTLETQNCETLGECFNIVSAFKKWQLTQETKKIAGYLCYKATTVIKRNNKKNNIVAWYCPQIPVSFGPYKYNGLPGLILELDNSHIYFRATKLILNPKEKVIIKKPTKGKRLSQKEYDKMSKEAWSKI